ncbi:MAG: OmpA family protein [Methylococcaceae bacterium]|nr:OmpA family protein [Methylococcaceae bacterium]MCI0732618.1 OmpA family protein [Methylococcaceae bacterium]
MHRSETPRESTLTCPPDNSWVYAGPWDENEPGQQTDTDNWLLSYADMLTLMLTLLVMLLAFNHIQNKHPGPAQIKNALEVMQSAKQSKETTPGHSDTELIAKRTEIPAALNYRTVHKTARAPLYRQYIADLTPPPFWSPDEAQDDLSETESRGRLVSQSLKELDLSIDAVDALNHFEITSPALRAYGQFKNSSARQVAEPPVRETTQPNDVERFQRLISEQNLDGLIEVSKAPNAVRMEVNERILFETGEAELKPNGMTLLNELAKLLQNQPGNIHIEGHTDDVPIATARFPSNWELSAGRASSVARYLIGHSVDPDRLRAIGFADTRPRAGNHSPEGRSKNRRVSLVIEMDDSKSDGHAEHPARPKMKKL